MDATYAGSTIRQTYIAMGTMFRAAVMNDMITKHPMDGVRYTKPVQAANDIKFLTVEEAGDFSGSCKAVSQLQAVRPVAGNRPADFRTHRSDLGCHRLEEAYTHRQ